MLSQKAATISLKQKFTALDSFSFIDMLDTLSNSQYYFFLLIVTGLWVQWDLGWVAWGGGVYLLKWINSQNQNNTACSITTSKSNDPVMIPISHNYISSANIILEMVTSVVFLAFVSNK